MVALPRLLDISFLPPFFPVQPPMVVRDLWRLLFTLGLVSCALFQITQAQTVYTVVIGNQNYVVGSSTLRSGLFVSYDGTNTWKHVGPENLKAYSMDAVDSSSGRVLYIAAGNGVHRSTDYGETWKIVTNWRVTEVLDVKVDQKDPRYLYAATAWGFWRSTDGGDTWENPAGPLQESYCYQILPDPTNTTVAVVGDGPRQQARYFSFDNGSTWSEFPNELRGKWKNAIATCNLLIPNHLALIGFADSAGFHIDRNMVLRGIESDKPPVDTTRIEGTHPGTFPIHALAVVATDAASTILAGTFGDGIYKWNGTSWEFAGLPNSQVWHIVVKNYTAPVEVGHVH